MLCLLTFNKFYHLYFFYVKSLLPMGQAYEAYKFKLYDIQFIHILLIGYKWSARVNDKLLQKDISEDQVSS